MKKLYSTIMMLALMVAALSFIACGGDDDEVDNGGGNASIIGVWECTQYDFDTDYPEMFDGSETQIGDRVCFKSDGTYYTECIMQDNETGRWNQKGNTLTMVQNAPYAIPVDYKIEKLTSTVLEFSGDIGICKFFCRCKRVS